MSELQLGAKVIVDASQADAELKKLNDRIRELKEVQQEFISLFGEASPEVEAITKAISDLENKIGASAGAATQLAQNLSNVEAPELEIKLGEVPPVDPGEIPPVEIPVTVGEIPPIEVGQIPPVNIETNVGEITADLNQGAEAAKSLSAEIVAVSDPVDLLNEQLNKTEKELADAVKAFGKGSPEADKLAKKVEALRSGIDKLKTPVGEFNKALDGTSKELTDTGKAFNTIPGPANAAAGAVGDLVSQEQKLADVSDDAASGQKKLGQEADNAGKNVDKLGNKLEETSKSAKEGAKSTGGLMTILKAGGIIGAATAAFDMFKNALGKNQKVADTLAAVMKTIEQVLGAVVEVIVNVVTQVSESTNGFDALGKVMKGLLTVALTPLKMAFGGIKLFIAGAQLAWEQSFFGDGDPETIKELRASIDETKESMKETAVAAWEAGKDIVTNLGEAVDEVGQVVGGVVKGVSEISVGAIYDNAKATVELQNNARLAAASLAGVVEQYGAQAERLRQIRDDDRLSISERIAANTELGEVLKKQQQAQLALVNQNIAAAQAELNANSGSIELKEKLIQAENERKAVLNQIAGFQSEQLANEKALAAEALALAKATGQAETDNYLARKKNAAELITDELAKNEALQAIRNEERALEIQRLTEEVDKHKQGTQARLDAEIELQNKINELDNEDAQAKQQREALKIQRANETNNAIIANEIAANNIKKQLLESESSNLRQKSERKLQLLRDESALLVKQLQGQRDQEIAEAEKAGKSTVEIKQKYALAIQAVNNQLLQSEKELALAVLEENQKKAEDVFKTIEAAVGFYQQLMENQLQRVEQRQAKEAEVQKQLLADKKITQEQYEKNVKGINDKAEKDKIKIQKRQIIADKAVNIANIVMSTLAANAQFNLKPGFPASIPLIIANSIQGALAVASSIAQASKAIKALGGGGEGSGGGGDAAQLTTGTAPVAPVMGSTTLNPSQVNDMVQSRAEPVRAYIVESDVRNGQERLDRIERAATIG